MYVQRLREELKCHPDIDFVNDLCDGISYGFDTLMSSIPASNFECKNLRSALNEPNIVSELIASECDKGFLLGPFESPPFDTYRVSPIGVATGKYSNKKRLIVDLSAPHDNISHDSINGTIDKDVCSLSYVKVDDAIRVIQQKGRNAKLCKTDISDAFKLIPIRKDQWRWFGIKWDDKYYFYQRLAFGCRSSPVLFDKLSQAICWIAVNNYNIECIFHLLDDFLTVDDPDSDAERTMAILTLIFSRLNVPLAKHKTVGPTTCLEYLGVILDTDKLEARLPEDKIKRMLEFLDSMLGRKTCTQRELLVLLGHLNFASRIILPGRSFVSHLIRLSTTVKKLHHRVHFNAQCQRDLYMWKEFLQNWNGISMFDDQHLTNAADMELFTDASSTIGFGGFFQKRWFASRWPDELYAFVSREDVVSMSFMELYPIVVAALLWGSEWNKKKVLFNCDNMGTVEIINKGRSKSPLIMQLMRRLTMCSMTHNFCIYSVHVKGTDNFTADFLSRLQIHKFRQAVPDADPTPHQCPPPSEVMML